MVRKYEGFLEGGGGGGGGESELRMYVDEDGFPLGVVSHIKGYLWLI